MSFRIAPFKALRYDEARLARAGCGPEASTAAVLDRVAAPPYDIISPDAHRSLLARSPYGIVRLTLGDQPGQTADYGARSRLLTVWKREGILREDPRESFYVYGTEYTIPGTKDRASFRGLLALGSLHEFPEKLVLPHEQTFPKVVDDRFRILEATRTHLEMILLLYADPEGRIDGILEQASKGRPEVSVEGKPGEVHALWRIPGGPDEGQLRELFRGQRPIIADGHHRYTTALRYLRERSGDGTSASGARWQPMVLGNLFGKGLAILATHRLVAVGGKEAEALRILEKNLAPAPDGAAADFEVETRGGRRRFALPKALRESKKGVARTNYALLHDVVLGQWLQPLLQAGAPEGGAVKYFKDGTGEREALVRGEGDLLIRMLPVDRAEFREVVEGGEVFPHKTTFFYPKLWSGLALWTMTEPVAEEGC